MSDSLTAQAAEIAGLATCEPRAWRNDEARAAEYRRFAEGLAGWLTDYSRSCGPCDVYDERAAGLVTASLDRLMRLARHHGARAASRKGGTA